MPINSALIKWLYLPDFFVAPKSTNLISECPPTGEGVGGGVGKGCLTPPTGGRGYNLGGALGGATRLLDNARVNGYPTGEGLVAIWGGAWLRPRPFFGMGGALRDHTHLWEEPGESHTPPGGGA